MSPAVKGVGRCRIHGGKSPNALAAAERNAIQHYTMDAARHYGKPRAVNPIDALQEELNRTQGHVDWLSERIANNSDPGWLSVYQAERSQLSNLAHKMLVANTDERRTIVAEQITDKLEKALVGILTELGHSAQSPHIRAVVARHLKVVSQADGKDSGPPKVLDAIPITPDDDEDLPQPVDF